MPQRINHQKHISFSFQGGQQKLGHPDRDFPNMRGLFIAGSSKSQACC